MNRRDFLVSAATVPYLMKQGLAPTRPPNVLILHSHDLGRFLGCYGLSTVRTPNLDRFASEGVLFERSFAVAPQCSPSRAAMFTGRYPHSNGVLGLTGPSFMWDFHSNELHLGQILKQAGYRTSCIGVMHETRSPAARCGFDEFDGNERATHVADKTIETLTRFSSSPATPFYIQAGTLEPHRLPNPEPAHDLDFLGGDLQADDSRGVTVPGYLRDTPGTRKELSELQGSVHHVDTQMGRVLDAVQQLGLAQNTLVIFTTDHGNALPRAKCSLHDPGLETAFILRLPTRNGWHGGVRQRVPISNIDYLPTILDVTGIGVPPTVQGRSFAPLLDGREYTARNALFSELTFHDYYDPRRAVRTEDYKLLVNFSSAPEFMDPSQSWRPRSDALFPANHALSYHPPMELYDLRQDPWEQHNAAGDPRYQPVKAKLRELLREHMQHTDDPLLKGAVPCPMHRQSMAWLLA